MTFNFRGSFRTGIYLIKLYFMQEARMKFSTLRNVFSPNIKMNTKTTKKFWANDLLGCVWDDFFFDIEPSGGTFRWLLVVCSVIHATSSSLNTCSLSINNVVLYQYDNENRCIIVWMTKLLFHPSSSYLVDVTALRIIIRRFGWFDIP